jgi:broad specificity phosphatase PhoE
MAGVSSGSRIVLVRHGKPDWNNTVRIRGCDLAGYIHARDNAPIDPSVPPSDELRELARATDVFCSSPLRRSRESAHLLAPDAPLIVDVLFREVYTPTAIASKIRLPAKAWGLIARARWLAGWSPGVESYKEARLRARKAAAELQTLSRERGNLLLAAHGVMNVLIAGRLKKDGWKGPFLRARHYWSFMIYERVGRSVGR